MTIQVNIAAAQQPETVSHFLAGWDAEQRVCSWDEMMQVYVALEVTLSNITNCCADPNKLAVAFQSLNDPFLSFSHCLFHASLLELILTSGVITCPLDRKAFSFVRWKLVLPLNPLSLDILWVACFIRGKLRKKLQNRVFYPKCRVLAWILAWNRNLVLSNNHSSS